MESMPVSKVEHQPDYKFEELSDEQQTTVLRRLMKIYVAHDHATRGAAVRAEEKLIAKELHAAKKEKT
jgi:hypothetical protein